MKHVECYDLLGVPEHGAWSAWGEWSSCSDTVDGSRMRTRTCDNPPPLYGGEDCSGDAIETEQLVCPGE